MTPRELFEAGRLSDAIDAQAQKVKSSPADPAARMLLFEFLLFTGDLDRAGKHLDLLRYENPQAVAGIEMYRHALAAEAKRKAVLAGREQPTALFPAPDHVTIRLQALAALARGEAAAVRTLLDQADELAPRPALTLNGAAAEGLRDWDERFGPVLEVIGSGGNYCWVPFEHIAALTVSPPRFPRDIVYLPAHLEIQEGPAGDVLLPNLYPDSFAAPDDALRLGRATDWTGGEDGPLFGLGGKAFVVGERTVPLLEWRELQGPTP